MGGDRKKKEIKNASGSFDRDGKLYSVTRVVQCGTLGPCSELCREPSQHVPETVELATSSRVCVCVCGCVCVCLFLLLFFATFARPSAVSALACEERHDDNVCGDVFVCGQSGVSVTEGGMVTLYFLMVRMDMGPIQTNK